MASPIQPGAALEELMLRVAIACGVAEYATASGQDAPASLPSSPSRRSLLKQAVQEGYEAFLAADPAWSFLRLPVRVVLEADGSGPDQPGGDPGRALLPLGVASAPLQGWSVTTGESPGDTLLDVPASVLVAARADRPEAGRPEAGAVRPSRESAGSVRWEALIWPVPDRRTVIEAEFVVSAPRLDGEGDRHAAGPQHDRVIAAMAEAAFLRRDVSGGATWQRLASAEQTADRLLGQARASDAKLAPRLLGRLGDTTARAHRGHRRLTNSDPFTVVLPD